MFFLNVLGLDFSFDMQVTIHFNYMEKDLRSSANTTDLKTSDASSMNSFLSEYRLE